MWPSHRRLRSLWPALVCCLLVALPCAGLSGVMTAMLGANHIHRDVAAVADPMAGWTDFRRSDHAAETTAPHRHSHSLFQRHHHDPDDATVVSLDGSSADGASGDDGSSSGGCGPLVLALASPLRVAPASEARATWHVARATIFTSRAGDRLERPPRG